MTTLHFRILRIYRSWGYMLDWQQLDLLAPLYPAVQELRPVDTTYSAIRSWLNHTYTPARTDRRMIEKISFRR